MEDQNEELNNKVTGNVLINDDEYSADEDGQSDDWAYDRKLLSLAKYVQVPDRLTERI